METSANRNPVPDLIPSTLTTKIISTAGENGLDGSVYPPGHRTGKSSSWVSSISLTCFESRLWPEWTRWTRRSTTDRR
jgi:hypothetical protein